MTQPALAHNVRGKGRHYTHPVTGAQVPSVTNIIGVLDKPAIPRWAAKMVAINAWKMRQSLDAMGEDEAIDILKGSPWRKSGRAADRGTSVHDYLEARAEGRDVELSGEAATYKTGADLFLDMYRPQFVHTEFTVFGDGYAGTGDFIAHLGDRLVIGDYKTNANGRIYPEVALQLAALRFADEIVLPDGTVDTMPTVNGCVAVSITPETCRVVDVPGADRGTFGAFLACLRAWEWRKGVSPIGQEVPA